MSGFTLKQGKLVRKIENFSKPFVIAEIGVNHDGNIKLAKELIDVSKEAGADAVKFQTFKAENLVLKNTKKANYQEKNTKSNQNQFEMLKHLEISFIQLKKLRNYANSKNLYFSTTPYNLEDISLLKELQLPFVKAASIHCGEPYFIKQLSKLKIPVFMSTGLSDEKTVNSASLILRQNLKNKYVILQCTTNYPADISEANINVLDNYRKQEHTIGFSDHTIDNIASLLALSKGASVFEKHITLNKKKTGPDHYASLNPKEFKKYVDDLNYAYTALGSSRKSLTASELENYKQMKRSIYFNKDLKKGHKIKINDLLFMRPFNNKSLIEDIDNYLGKKLITDVDKHSLLSKKVI